MNSSGKRDFTKYAESGKAHIRRNGRYDINTAEISFMRKLLLDEEIGFFNIVGMAYYAGVEAGYRIASSEKGGLAK